MTVKSLFSVLRKAPISHDTDLNPGIWNEVVWVSSVPSGISCESYLCRKNWFITFPMISRTLKLFLFILTLQENLL